MAVDEILQMLTVERDRLNRAIEALEGSGNHSRGRKPAKKGRRPMSAAGRKRIAEAQKKRWAEKKKAAG